MYVNVRSTCSVTVKGITAVACTRTRGRLYIVHRCVGTNGTSDARVWQWAVSVQCTCVHRILAITFPFAFRLPRRADHVAPASARNSRSRGLVYFESR